jgi:hypothetical protein
MRIGTRKNESNSSSREIELLKDDKLNKRGLLDVPTRIEPLTRI